MRIFQSKRMRIATWLVLGIVIIYGTWASFTNIFLCSPIEVAWDVRSVPFKKTNCLDLYKVFAAYTSLNIGTDVFILLLPLPVLQGLMMPRGQKIGLTVVFLLGILSVNFHFYLFSNRFCPSCQ